MKLTVRRIGNSLGIIIPRATLEAWNVKEGGHLELTATSIRPPSDKAASHQALDELKRSISLAVVRSFTPVQIRAQILANLHRWRAQGMWVSAYDEWQAIASDQDDGRLYAAMLGRDEEAIQLRQSMPYVGLLPQTEGSKLNEEAAA